MLRPSHSDISIHYFRFNARACQCVNGATYASEESGVTAGLLEGISLRRPVPQKADRATQRDKQLP